MIGNVEPGLVCATLLCAACSSSVTEAPKVDSVFIRPTARAVDPKPAVSGDESFQERVTAALARLKLAEFERLTEATHALRLWGADDPAVGMLFNSNELEGAMGVRLHGRTPYGIGFSHAVHVGRKGEMHSGQVLAAIADAGLPSSREILVDDQSYTVRALIRHELANVALKDSDLPWVVTGLARYVPLDQSWQNKHGEEVSLGQIAQELCSRQMGDGSCHGTHTLYALALLLAFDLTECRLPEPARDAARAMLRSAANQLIRTQEADGSWGAEWPGAHGPERAARTDLPEAAIVATGHHLEWLAIAPGDYVDRETIRRACDFLVVDILNRSAADIRSNYCPLTHAGNALRLWCPHGLPHVSVTKENEGP